jgi:catechol 2,3-dioxygenase-like lactoylglutathione lyase family enzyme
VEPIISDLVERFERGGLTRRELIRGLSLLMATAAAPATAATVAAPVSAPVPIAASGIDHVSVLVSDLQRSAKFYQDLFGFSVLSEDKEHGILRMGGGGRKVLVSIRKEQPYGTVDHFGVRVEGFDKAAVTQNLRQRGLQPDENWQYGFYVKDPDGVNVQML